MSDFRNAKELKQDIEKRVKGQDDAITAVAYAVSIHLKRIEKKRFKRIKKDNILLIGPTGCGKTETYRVLKENELNLRVPVHMFAALSYAPTGSWQGNSVENFLKKLWIETTSLARDIANLDLMPLPNVLDDYKDYIVNLMQKAIIVIDEVDKIADIGGETRTFSHDYQSTLLQMVEGHKYQIPLKDGDQTTSVEIDTTNMLFIMMGAFDGLEKITAERIREEQHQPIGFSTANSKAKSETVPSTDDIVKYGFLQELVGRMTLRAYYHALSVDELVRIMNDCDNSAYHQFQERFHLWGHKLIIDKSGLTEIAKLALARKTGARGLQNILTDLLYKTLFHLTPVKKSMLCILTGNDIKNNHPPVIKINYESLNTRHKKQQQQSH